VNRQTFKKLFVAYLITVVVAWIVMGFLFSVVGPPEVDEPVVAFVVFPIAAAIGLAFLFLVIGIGIFVYHDAKQRGMEAIPWTIVAILVPYFIGFIAYLLVRQSVQVTCPSCGNRASSEAAFCPRCGKELKLLCSKCNQPIVSNASFCPNCGAEVAKSNRT
jgi:predicted RNA-binding Zn-ribbon protein involved in translation (DUF1610 family)